MNKMWVSFIFNSGDPSEFLGVFSSKDAAVTALTDRANERYDANLYKLDDQNTVVHLTVVKFDDLIGQAFEVTLDQPVNIDV
jgi:hypothetical protein